MASMACPTRSAAASNRRLTRAQACDLRSYEPGYEEVMVRAAAFSAIDDLPADMRGFVDGMLAEHERHLARDREARSLAERIREYWRRWPELGRRAADRGCAPEDLPEHPAWREEGAALLEEARATLAGALPASGLAGAARDLECVRLLDDAGRFERAWRALRERAAREGLPEGHAEVAGLGGSLLEAEDLDPSRRRVLEEWRQVHGEQTAMAGAVRTLPDRAAAWRERRAADLPLDEHGGADPACRAWREEGETLRSEAAGMLEAESPHAPHLAAMPDERRKLDETAHRPDISLAGVEAGEMDRLAEIAEEWAAKTGGIVFDAPQHGEIGKIRLSGRVCEHRHPNSDRLLGRGTSPAESRDSF